MGLVSFLKLSNQALRERIADCERVSEYKEFISGVKKTHRERTQQEPRVEIDEEKEGEIGRMIDENLQGLISTSMRKAKDRTATEGEGTTFMRYLSQSGSSAIMSPRARGRPSLFVDDESYVGFLQQQNSKLEDAIVFFKSTRNKLAVLLDEAVEEKWRTVNQLEVRSTLRSQ
eukprot:TRINITY_DN3732_c0_g1_i5.p1 TRINITY_DN3732_c0_g1~~TRINITY_DN3732_c0_g1_i5.p1  ORF type:complete len:173 (+),score=34.83 TRINITY_DN3732_c0_g1_i5:507-1025(+)